MVNFQKRISQPWRTLVQQLKKPALGLLMTAGLVTGATIMADRTVAAQPQPAQPEDAQLLADGVYLYGQSEQPNQIGSEYLVFEVKQGQVTGGFYMPRSSFDCFYGNVEANQLALTVIDSYEQTPHAYAVALQTEDSVATEGEPAVPVGLEGYHRLDNLSAMDHQILSTCKVDQS